MATWILFYTLAATERQAPILTLNTDLYMDTDVDVSERNDGNDATAMDARMDNKVISDSGNLPVDHPPVSDGATCVSKAGREKQSAEGTAKCDLLAERGGCKASVPCLELELSRLQGVDGNMATLELQAGVMRSLVPCLKELHRFEDATAMTKSLNALEPFLSN